MTEPDRRLNPETLEYDVVEGIVPTQEDLPVPEEEVEERKPSPRAAETFASHTARGMDKREEVVEEMIETSRKRNK